MTKKTRTTHFIKVFKKDEDINGTIYSFKCYHTMLKFIEDLDDDLKYITIK